MRSSLFFGSSVLVAALFAAAACSDSSSTGDPAATQEAGPGADAAVAPEDAAEDTATASDGGKDAEEPLTSATEVEPNNGATKTEVGTMKLPGIMNGKIDPVSDVDLFTIDLTPGDFWEWSAAPTTADLAPHITVCDIAAGGLNPTVVGYAAAGATAKLQHFVLRPGTFVMGMRDARNIPAPGTKGGPTFGYAVTAKRAAPQPVSVTFPITKTGKLASVGSVDLYTFPGTGGKGFDIVVNAARKQPASTLDSRLSLFDLTAKKAIITNDNASGSTTDSQIGGADPLPSTYLVIVENEGKNEADLSYEIQFKLRP
ncbi:hypothetical protein BH11MYX4_BH11MYX4_61690 [soil metagenome]